MYAVTAVFVSWGLLLCVAVGFVSGAINVVAGGGSFLTLPVLLFLGLPASVANGTNRVGVLAQNVSAVWGFHQHAVMDWRWGLSVSAPAIAGAALGAWAALAIPDFAFRRLLSVVMLVMTLGTLVHRSRSGPRPEGLRPPFHWSMVLGFFLVGIYGGFLQAGVGFLILGMTTLAGMDLVRGNAIKVLSVMLLTLLSLAIFAGTGNVDWMYGAALGVGNFLGGIAGVRLTVLRGHTWIEHVVTVTIVVFAVLLWVM
jgi:uncharacterized protein